MQTSCPVLRLANNLFVSATASLGTLRFISPLLASSISYRVKVSITKDYKKNNIIDIDTLNSF